MGPTSASHESAASGSGGASRAGPFTITETIADAKGFSLHRGASENGETVELAALAPSVSGPEARAAIEQYAAAAKDHGISGLSNPLGVVGEGSQTFLASTATHGGPLSALLARKRSTGAGGFAPRATANLLGRLCTITAELHKRGLVHGAINLETVRVDKAGGVHLTGLGLAPIAPLLARAAPSPGAAPELASGSAATASTDLYAIGAVLYEVLVGTAPARGCARPSEVVPELSADVDKVVAAAMHPSIERRPPDAETFGNVLAAALSGQPVSAPKSRAARPSLAESLQPGAEAGARSSGQIAAALSADDEAWLISKDRLDHGPFSMAVVFEMIRKDEILPGNIIINKHTGERAPVEEHPMLAELVDEAKAARDERRRAQAEVVHSKTEKRRGVVLYGFIAAAVIGLAGGAYLIINKLSADKSKANANIGSLEEGELQATISFPTRDKSRKKGKRTGGKKGKRGGGGNEGGWDDAVDFGDASKGGGDERLDDSQINPVIQGAGGRLGGCLRKNGGGRAAIKFIIKGTGRVSYVAVNGKTDTGLAKCIGRVVRGLKFPSFDGARTRANFTMSF